MSKRYLAAAVLAAAAVMLAPTAASAAVSAAAGATGPAAAAGATGVTGLAAAGVASAAGTHPLKVRGGLTLHLPGGWKAYGKGDWIRVVTGRCATPSAGFGTPGCDSFWVLGPAAIKVGQELFRPYTGKQPFYPATDVQRCPHDGASGQRLYGARVTGLRQVGPGHRAAYREWRASCVSYANGKPKSAYTQREWFLPTTRVLVLDQWNTPGLAGVLARATWS
jgi:hypothetical protein